MTASEVALAAVITFVLAAAAIYLPRLIDGFGGRVTLEEHVAAALAPEPLLCPECENGKPVNCVGETLDVSTDSFVPCGGVR